MQLDRGKLLGAGIALAVGALVLLLWPREQQTPEALIKARVEAMADAAGQRDVAFIMEQISERFRARGGADKQQIKGIIASQVFRGEIVQVWPVSLDVTLDSPSLAQLKGRFLFARKQTADLQTALTEGGVTAYRIDGTLEKESGDEWRFVSAEYERLEATDLF